MIVNQTETGWDVLFQRTHALLAAQLVAPWRRDQRPERWTELLVATAQHDDIEGQWEGTDLLSDLGTPIDFSRQSNETNVAQARFVVDNAVRQSLYIALLISRHNSVLYAFKRGEDKHLDAFLDEQATQQRTWCKALGMNEDDLARAYALLHWGDRMSLILCKQELPERERWLDVYQGPDGVTYRVMQRDADSAVVLDPWPYDDMDALTVGAEVRALTDLTYADTLAYRTALEDQLPTLKTWTLVRATADVPASTDDPPQADAKRPR